MLLSCNNLCFAYADTPVLAGLSFSLREGEVVALLGPNGSGKSTLLRCLLGQLAATGDIAWDGRPLSQWIRRELARRIAYLAQAVTPNPAQTVLDVLRMGRTPYLQAFGVESAHDMDVVREIAGSLDLSPLINRRIDELSGGQRQRVFLGRCLVQEPAVLLLDEPSTYLDLKHQVELGSLLRTLARQKKLAILMASHDLNLAGQIADRLIVLSQGRIAADGVARDVLRPDLLQSVYGVPMEAFESAGTIHVFPAIRPSIP
ncbi:MAG TPA: ABC transporter ATP-binding protein [Tepidisphaeraceae bacterium]|jgi:iron complex transport system ATP-binding protein|nr:ABC transporter ATP-binding protein [Tepidisphaeraceae bacterium]